MPTNLDRRHVGRTVRKEVRIAAPADAVWNAWAQPEDIARWFVDRAEGAMRAGATVTWCFDAFGYRLPVEVFAAVPGEYLAFGGEPPGRPPALQEVFVEHHGGETVLRVVNSGFGEGPEWDDEYEGVDSGWELALATLRHYLERYPGRARRHALVMRPADFAYENVQPFFATAAGLASWLAASARLSAEPLVAGAAGVQVELDLGDAGTLVGSVLARSRREVLLSWEEREAVLGLKCFAIGARRAVALDWSCWSERPESLQTAPWLEASVDRLASRLA
jgi:uncharacterized protein YndB with AHSA1/START domain